MLGEKDNQSDFFENYISNLVPEDHILLRIEKKIDFSPIEQRLGSFYSGRMGRPSYPPLVLFKMLLLEYFYNLSDVKISQECQYNLLFRKFIGLKISQKVPDDTSLVIFRKRIGEKVFKELFDLIVKQAKKKGLTGEELGIVDASAIQANISEFNGVNILRQARRHLVRAVETETNQEFTDKEKYITKGRAIRKPKPKPEQVAEEKEKTKQLVESIKGKYGKTVEAKIALVEEMLSSSDEEIPKIKSMVDSDARYGMTSRSKSFTGYKVAISYDNDSEIVSSCDLMTGNQNEGKDANFKRLINDDKDKRVQYKAMAGDSAYDSLNNRMNAYKQGMKVFFSPKIFSHPKKEKNI